MGICSKLFNRPVSGQASCGFITRALLVTVCFAWAAGCSKSTGLSSTTPAALTIDSTPFGETNGKDEYNASGIVPLADARFLICDNNTNDALFELDFTPDGQKKGQLIRRPLRGLAPGSIDDVEDMAVVEEDGGRY